MGLLGAFRKIGRALKHPAALAGAQAVAVFVPVAGPAISLAIEVARAKEVKYGKGNGDLKRKEALQELTPLLKAAGLSDKRVRAILELAILAMDDEAEVITGDRAALPELEN